MDGREPAGDGAPEPGGPEEVEQVTDRGHRVRLLKSVHRLPGPPPLHLVRKHLPGGPTRPPVLLVHGFAQNRYTWHTTRRSPSAWLAARGWDVWNLELRGHGRNRTVGAPGAERFEDYVADVLRAAEALPDRAFWIGHSLGGTVLYAAAAARPEATRGVTGIGALYRFGRANPVIGALCRLTWRLAPLERLQVRTRLAGVALGRLYGLSDVLGYAFPVSGWWPGSIEREVLAERLDRGFDWTSLRVWREMSRWSVTDRFATDDCDCDAAWRRTDVPLLVLLGDRDHLVPPPDGRAAWERSGSRDRTLVVLDDWHHRVHWGHLDLVLGREAPAVVWPLIDEWMAERAGAGPGEAGR